MSDLVLYVFAQKNKFKVDYTFVLEERNRLPLIGIRPVPKADVEYVHEVLSEIAQAQANDPSREEYVQAVGSKISQLSELLRVSFWPWEDEAFGKRFNKLLKEAISQPTHLLIASNASNIPWWITQAGGTNIGQTISDIFGVGMISLRKPAPEPRRSKSPIRLQVITCPTQDLAGDETLQEVDLSDVRPQMPTTLDYRILNGRTAKPPGLASNEVKKAIQQARILVYHGHFALHKTKVALSTITTSGPRQSRGMTAKLPIASLSLTGKDLVLVSCETAGISPRLDETLSEYLAEKNSTLIGSLYPVIDDQARLFAKTLARCLLEKHLSWGESVRLARSANDPTECALDLKRSAEQQLNAKLFAHAAFCYFGIPWHMSPLFGARKELHILMPNYLRDVYNVVRPSQVYSAVREERFVKVAELEKALAEEYEATRASDGLLLAALPSVFVNDLLAKEKGKWRVLGPLVSSRDDVYLVSRSKLEMVLNCSRSEAKRRRAVRAVHKGSDLTASAFVDVIAGRSPKWKRLSKRVRWETLENDCAAAINAGLADLGLVVAREDLSETDDFFANKDFAPMDTILADEIYHGKPVPRILWVTKASCLDGKRRNGQQVYLVEFFERMAEKIRHIKQPHRRDFGSGIVSKLWLYALNDRAAVEEAREIVLRFVADWVHLARPKRKAALTRESFYDLFPHVKK